MAEGEVAVLIEVGAEKLRYLCGQAVAVKSDGEILCVNLGQIYQLIAENWGLETTRAEH